MTNDFQFDADGVRGHGRIPVKKFIDDYVYRIDIDADYQRGRVWELEDQALLLDSIANGIDIPKLYLADISNEKGQFDYECIDGKQRIVTLLNFYKPEKLENTEKAVKFEFFGKKLSYKELQIENKPMAERIDNYLLDFTLYNKNQFEDEKYVRKIFRRLNLGLPLNSGEKLHGMSGSVRDFVFDENLIGDKGVFFKNTNLSVKRFSRGFTLAQIFLVSFRRQEKERFVRARFEDIETFFEEEYKLPKNDPTFERVKTILKIMDDMFGERSKEISSRAIATSAYFFFEDLFLQNKKELYKEFADFFLKLLDEIRANQKLLSEYSKPRNTRVLEEFQKYIAQASAEASSFSKRAAFLNEAFNYFVSPATKGKIIGEK